MGMFDVYEPKPELLCARCAKPLRRWQGKDGPCGLWIWRQGEAWPVGQQCDPQWRSSEMPPPLPERFSLAASCCRWVEAVGETTDGVWTHTRRLTPPLPTLRGVNGRWSCPCCGCFTLDEQPPGSHLVCPVCYWEDDSVQYADPTLSGGANRVDLTTARRNYLAYGATEGGYVPHVREPTAVERGE
ncbi:MAG: CPCC family cysteine-rich protein [Myxococcota bacterium]